MSNKTPAHCGISHLDPVTQKQQAARAQQVESNRTAGSKSIDAAARHVIKVSNAAKGGAK